MCVPKPKTQYKAFWENLLPIMDAVIHMILPGALLLPTHLAIEHYFWEDERYMNSLPPREKNKMRYKRQRDTVFITEQGWTRAILYSGTVHGYL